MNTQNMQQLMLLPIPFEEFKSVLSDIVKSELKSEIQSLPSQQQPTDLLTRKETAKLLGISLPTLHNWTTEGRIPAYRIARRVRYKRAEVEESLIKIRGGKSND
jgi:excisionase family DNA binding protein